MINNLEGMKFGDLEVIKCLDEEKSGKSLWECRCDCGKKMYGIIKRSEVWKKNKLWMPERVPETFGRKKIWALDSDRGNRRKTKKRENVALPL